MNDINEYEELDSFTVLGAYTAGLVAKMEKVWLKGSIDFLATIKTPLGFVEAWPIDIKACVKTITANVEKEYNQLIDQEKYLQINDCEVSKNIRDVGERYQLLHHCYMYGLKPGSLVIGDKQSQIIQATVVEYGADFLEDYGQVLEDIKDEFLGWVYSEDYDKNSTIIPREVIKIPEDITSIKMEATLYGTLKLWKLIFDNVDHLPLPVLLQILPIYHAYWNAIKSGSDTTTMMADKCANLKTPVPHTTCNSKMSSRIAMVNLALSLITEH